MSKSKEAKVPAAVTEALARRKALQPAKVLGHSKNEGRVLAGDLRVIRPVASVEADLRLGLVLRVRHSPNGDFAEVALVHTAPEWATSRDVVITKSDSTFPHLVIQTDLRGVVWLEQLSERMGRLGGRSMMSVRDVGRQAIPAAADTYTGTPLAGPSDGRWVFKAAEGVALRALAAHCSTSLMAAF